MANGYDVTHDTMVKGAQAVDDAATEIKGLLQALDNEVTMLGSGWKGQAQTAFFALHQNWDAQQSKLITALSEMHATLVATGQTYVNQEEDQASAFSSIASQI